MKGCSVAGCGRKHLAKGLCSPHYQRQRTHGDALTGGTMHGAPQDFLEQAVRYAGDDCLAWPFGRDTFGYGKIRLHGRDMSVHRAVCEIAHGPAPSQKHEAAHSCGRGHEGCISPRHLRWATHRENHSDRAGHGTNNAGEKSGAAKLSKADVLCIRELQGASTQADLAKRFGVTDSTVRKIFKREIWRQI